MDEAAADFHTEGSVEQQHELNTGSQPTCDIISYFETIYSSTFHPVFLLLWGMMYRKCEALINSAALECDRRFFSLSLFALKEHFLKMPLFFQTGSPNIPLRLFFSYFFRKTMQKTTREINKCRACVFPFLLESYKFRNRRVENTNLPEGKTMLHIF